MVHAPIAPAVVPSAVARRLPRSLTTVCALLAAACSSDRDVPVFAPVTAMTIDPSGGTIEITDGVLAGTRLEVPPGALTQPVQISIAQDFADSHPGFVVAGRAARFEPQGLQFLLPVALTVPYTPGATLLVPVLQRRPGGAILELAPTLADDTLGVVTVDVDGLGTCWPAERTLGGVSTPRYFPLANGNTWSFDGDLTVAMTLATTEPNLTGNILRVLFTTPTDEYGVYLTGRTQFGPVTLVGEFVPTGRDSFQQVHEAQLFQPVAFTDGQPVEAFYEFSGFDPYGETTSNYRGTVLSRLVAEKVPELETPLGTFRDLNRLTMTRRMVFDDGSERTVEMSLTLAFNVGPVAVGIFGTEHRLISGTVSGQPITAPQ